MCRVSERPEKGAGVFSDVIQREGLLYLFGFGCYDYYVTHLQGFYGPFGFAEAIP